MTMKSKKIAVLTLNGYNNYGNRLQNYATQEVLRNLGFQCETIQVDRSDKDAKKIHNRLKNISSINGLNQKLYKKINNYYNRDLIRTRVEVFKKFTKNYINETDYIISNSNIPDGLDEKYDYFIVGSDQVWNPYHLHGTSFYFLTFVDDRKKKISYAASFGISQIPDEYINRYIKWLNGMHRISVREEAGAKIVKKLTDKGVKVLIDPTMMLTKEKWLSVSKESNCKPKQKYILTYFLGNVTKRVKKQINEVAKENKLVVINLLDMKNKGLYISGPGEFIDLINYADLLYTDSFHGVIFSILMKTPFIVLQRKSKGPSMFSRIDTLLSKFKLTSRKWDENLTNEEVFNLDFSHTDQILKDERNKALNYLIEALNIKDAD